MSPNAVLQTVGQVWPTTGKTALINPVPTALSPPVSVGIHCNHRITGPNAPTVEEWLWNWFGQNSGTACPTLTSYANATVGGLAVKQVGGQSWPSTAKSVWISGAPSPQKRFWE